MTDITRRVDPPFVVILSRVLRRSGLSRQGGRDVVLRFGLLVALRGLVANGTAIGLNQRMPYAPTQLRRSVSTPG